METYYIAYQITIWTVLAINTFFLFCAFSEIDIIPDNTPRLYQIIVIISIIIFLVLAIVGAVAQNLGFGGFLQIFLLVTIGGSILCWVAAATLSFFYRKLIKKDTTTKHDSKSNKDLLEDRRKSTVDHSKIAKKDIGSIVNSKRILEENNKENLYASLKGHKIKRVYLGLPKHLKNKVLWVSPEFRTNSLSHEPGGSDIVVEYHDQNVYGYDRIKMPSRYVQTFWAQGIYRIHENFNNLNDNDQLDVIRQKVKSLYARKYSENNYEVEEFKEIWNHKSSVISPLEILKEFDQ
jgi:hypothetical protein